MSPPRAIGIDLGGSRLKAGLVAADGDLSHSFDGPSRAQESAEAPLDAIAEAVSRLRGLVPSIVGIGLGCPGAIHPERGVLVGPTPHLPHWIDLPLRELLERRLGVAVTLDNDANLAALAEHRCGAACGSSTSITVVVGTGIGCGIVIEGRLLRGVTGGAGEIGHLPLGHEGIPCRCGIADCVEPEASGSGLAIRAREMGLEPADAISVFDAARRGDAACRALVHSFADRLGAAVATAVNLFNPEVVVVGGGVAQAGELLLGPLRAAVARYALASHRRALRIVPAALGDRAGVVGAGLLAWDSARDRGHPSRSERVGPPAS